MLAKPYEAVEIRHPACDGASRSISALRDARRITDSTSISRLDLNRDALVSATEHIIQQPPIGNQKARRYPVISLGAEHVVIGYLMRRNILAYKARPNNEGYDLICSHPDPKKSGEQVRVHVKSRYQSDCDQAFPLKERSLDAFDYLIIVFHNISYYYRKKPVLDGYREP